MFRHRRVVPSSTSRLIAGVVAIATVLVACEGPAAVVTTTPEPTPSQSVPVESTLQDGGLAPVSKSHPSPGAQDAFRKCQIGSFYPIDLVAGMAQVSSAQDVYHYVPLTGREPQLRSEEPAWVIRFGGDLQMRGETWTDPACIVTATDFGFYGVGPIRTESGAVVTPEPPAAPPDRALPTLAP